MNFGEVRKSERGTAILLAIFGLVLLSAVGLALLFGSDTETAISVNYRDKQVAMYAAEAGLQEARHRIHWQLSTYQGDLFAMLPTALPTKDKPNVLYIINPDPRYGETVDTIAPWNALRVDGSPNPFYDSELCMENIPDFKPAKPGDPCGPAGNAWYTYIDNSVTSLAYKDKTWTNAWRLTDTDGKPVPLPYKWVRVNLKADNMTPAIVGDGSGKQVCYKPPHEEQLPPQYGTDCIPQGNVVLRIAVTNPGSGYLEDPLVTISGGGGVNANAVAHIGQLPAGITSVAVINAGSNYGTTAPLVTVTSADGNGSGGAVKAILGGGVPVKSVTLSDPPAPSVPGCYQGGVTLTASFDAAAGSGGAATVQLAGTPGCIYAFTANGQCFDKRNTTVSVTASGGFSGTIAFDKHGNPGNYVVKNVGNFTSLPDSFTVDGCAGMAINPTPGYHIQQVTVQTGGSYVKPPDVNFIGATPGPGSAAPIGKGVLDGTPTAGTIVGLQIVSPGSGYTQDPKLTIAPPPGFVAPPGCDPVANPPCAPEVAQGTASIIPSKGVMEIDITDRGAGYTYPPTVTIGSPTGAPPTQATAVATVGKGSANQTGQVYLLTALAQTPTGARAMAQMEVAMRHTDFAFNLGGALTMFGPKPDFGTPNSENFTVVGGDSNACGTTQAYPTKPAIGVYTDPKVTDANNQPYDAVASVVGSLGKPENYTGANGTPSIVDIYPTMGGSEHAVDGLNQFVAAVQGVAASEGTSYGSDPPIWDTGTWDASKNQCTDPTVTYVNGDLTMGPKTGCGILLVTGTLTFKGDWSWHGLILVIGKGSAVMGGGGNGVLTGAMFVANTTAKDAAGNPILGSPSTDWSGGGTNSLYYDHCYADDYLNMIPFDAGKSADAYPVISMRPLQL